MNLKEYRQEAIKTVNPALTTEQRLNMLRMGLIGEVGEIADLQKKLAYHGKDIPSSEYVKECGDLLWYVICMAEMYEFEEIPYRKDGDLPIEYSIGSLCKSVGYLVSAPAPDYIWDQNRAYVKLELSNMISHLALILSAWGETVESAAEINIAKLRERHGEAWSGGNYNSKSEG